MILAVTALTSLDASDLAAIGVTEDVSTYVKRLARLAQDNGADGVVCAASEIAMLRETCGPDFKLVVPGIRPKGRSEEHTSELQSLMRTSYAVFCLTNNNKQ